MTRLVAVLAGLVLLLAALPAYAACSGSSPSLTAPTWNDVAACHTAATNGDTITVTPGSYTVTTATTITKYVKLLAGGTVTLTDNTPSVGNLLTIAESTAGSIRIQGFTFVQGTGIHANPNGVIALSTTVSGQPILITGNTYNAGSSGDFIIAGVNRGVIWSNTMTSVPEDPNCRTNSSFVRHKLTGAGTSWTTAATWGAADTNGTGNLYVETNTLNRVSEGIDVDDNARQVFRYNTVMNSGFIHHGVDTSGIYGARYSEIYSNTFVNNSDVLAQCAGTDQNRNGWIALRGGTSIIYNNVLPTQTTFAWGTKPAVKFGVEQLRRNAGGFACWDTVTAPGSGYPSPHQVGWGYITGATTVTGSSCANCPVSQDVEAVYFWGNTGGGNYDAPSLEDYNCGSGDACPSCNSCPLVATYLHSSRDYFINTQKPGYTAYTYPHPLTGGVTTYTINASAGANGTISPSGNVVVNAGASQAFTLTPSTGYHVSDVLVDGVSVGAVTSYTFSAVSTSHTISATFAINTYTITATFGAHGTLAPSVGIVVNYGGSQAFTITADASYHVADVLVDGVSVGAVTGYTFSNVTANHTISATFALNDYTITGTITLSGSPLANVSLAGATCTVTNALGQYSCGVSSGFSGAISPSLMGYIFTPLSRSYVTITSNQTSQNYTAVTTPTSPTTTRSMKLKGGITIR